MSQIFASDLLRIFVASVVVMVIGALWYSKFLFLNQWVYLNNLDKDNLPATKSKFPMLFALISALAFSFFIFFILDNVSFINTYAKYAFVFLIWFVFLFLPNTVYGLFQGKNLKTLALDSLKDLFAVLAVVFVYQVL